MGTSSFPRSESSASEAGAEIRPPDPEHWQRVEALFYEALDAAPEDLDAFLEARERDAQIRREVLELAASERRSEVFLEHSTQAYDVVETCASIPRSFGPYEIQREIGRGGMGVVFLAHDRRLGRQVAVKCLGGEGSPDSTERLEREARVLASLNHPNIATIFGLEPYPGGRALVLEYIAGQNLSDLLMAGPLALRHALRIGIQIASAVAAAHDQGVIHRDLKPANIRLCGETSSGSGPEARASSGLGRGVGGRVKVLDFGLAKPAIGISDEWVSKGITEEGKIVGTVSYMSPEQATGGAVDARTDVWAFGCVLFECLAGRRAFADDGAWRTLQAVLHQAPPWDLLPPDLPPRLVRFLNRCLRKDPDDRLRSLHDARLALEDVLAELESGERPAGGSWSPLGFRLPRRAVWGLIGVSALALAGLTGWAVGRVSPRPPAPSTAPAAAAGFSLAAAIPLDNPMIWSGRGAMTFSRDGSTFVFRSRDGLAVRHLSDFGETVLPGTAGAHEPFLSPDGKDVGFLLRDRLYKTSIDRPSLVRLTDQPLDGIGAGWSDDGFIIVAPSWSGGLSRVPDTGGELEPLTRLDLENREVSHRWPWPLPGGRGVLYTVKNSLTRTFSESTISVFDAESGTQKHLLDAATAPFFAEATSDLFFIRDESVYRAPFDLESLRLKGAPTRALGPVALDPTTGAPSAKASAAGHLLFLEPQPLEFHEKKLLWFEPSGARAAIDGFESRNIGGWVRLSPSGRYAAVWVVEANNSIWVYDLERGTSRMLTHGIGNCIFPVWHPDGEHIVYQVDLQGGEQGLGLVRADGTGQAEILVAHSDLLLPGAWTPDGRYLVFSRRHDETGLDLWLWDGDEKHASPYLQDHFDQRDPRVSPDGRFVAYLSTESGNLDVFVRLFVGSGPSQQISRGQLPSRGPFWSHDGTRLFFVQDNRLWQVSVPADMSGETPLEGFGRPLMLMEEGEDRIMEQHPNGRFIATENPERPPAPQRLLLKTFASTSPTAGSR